MNAAGARPSSAIRVLSPRIAPPPRFDPGSTASTAMRRPRAIPSSPKRSIKVDLPAPGGPEMPMRVAFPQAGRIVVDQPLGLMPMVGSRRFDECQCARQRPAVAAPQPRGEFLDFRRLSRRGSDRHARNRRGFAAVHKLPEAVRPPCSGTAYRLSRESAAAERAPVPAKSRREAAWKHRQPPARRSRKASPSLPASRRRCAAPARH